MEAIEQLIPERFEEIVRLYPDSLAVQGKQGVLGYTELYRTV